MNLIKKERKAKILGDDELKGGKTPAEIEWRNLGDLSLNNLETIRIFGPEGTKFSILGMGKGDASSSHGFLLDRSKVRILLCDNDGKSSEDVVQLLSSCLYQVTSVKTARQVIDVLAAHGSDIDIILAEVDLPVAKGFKMLKYINRDKELRRIPIIMMSSQDEVSVVVKCLRLGAADYLVKPLRRNELLNLWTHMWRRRRMLGMSEKEVISYDLELALSDPSDTHTNSTIVLSDDTDAKPGEGIQQDLNMPEYQENECNTSPVDFVQATTLEKGPDNLEDGDQVLSRGTYSCPKKTDLRIGQSSAFLTYVKSSVPSTNSYDLHLRHYSDPAALVDIEKNHGRGDNESHDNNWQQAIYQHANAFRNGENMCNMSTIPTPMKFPVICLSSANSQPQLRTGCQSDVSGSGIQPTFPLPIYLPGLMDQNVVSSPIQMFQGNLNNVQVHNAHAMLPQYSGSPQYLHVPVMPSFPYHPVGVNLQSGHMPPEHLSSSIPVSSHVVKCGQTERRAAALTKFRQKRKDRCYDKKIRYINRKRLAEKRPRVRGQFVRQVNGVDVQLNDFSAIDCDSEEDELELDSSSEYNASGC